MNPYPNNLIANCGTIIFGGDARWYGLTGLSIAIGGDDLYWLATAAGTGTWISYAILKTDGGHAGVLGTNLNTSYGFKATERTNTWGRELIREWLLEPIEPNSEILNVNRLRSTGLIQELIKWNKDGNFDRVSSLIAVLILDVTLNKQAIQAETRSTKNFLESDFFKERGFLKHNDDPFADNSYNENGAFFNNMFVK
jgi:hypothetical protein